MKDEKTPLALYNMGIADVIERKAKRLIFPTIMAAANFLGLQPNKLQTIISLGRTNYAYHSQTKVKYAVRAINQNEYDAEFTLRKMKNKTAK